MSEQYCEKHDAMFETGQDCLLCVRAAAQQPSELDSLRAENATLSESVTSQALLIASLNGEIERMKALDSESKYSLDFHNRQLSKEHADLRKALSDTKRQNAELMQLVDSMREALEAIKEAVCGEHVGRWDTFGRVYAIRGGIADACDIAIAASKVSNEDGKD